MGDHASGQRLDELRAREARYHAVIETSADGFMVLDPEGRLREVNDAYSRRSGYSRDELLAMRIQDLEIADVPADTAVRLARVARQGSDHFETIHRAKDGTVWPVEVTISHWPIEGGRFNVFVRDVARRTRAEVLLRTRLELSALADSSDLDALLRRALDAAELLTGSSRGFFHFVDEDQETITFQAWSTNTLRAMRAAPEKREGAPVGRARPWADCIGGRIPARHDAAAPLAGEGEAGARASLVREIVIPVMSGEKVLAIVGVGDKTTDYTDGDAATLREVAALVMDLVSRRQADEHAAERGKFIESLVDLSPNILYINDLATGRNLYGNGGFESILGYSPEDINGMGGQVLPALMHPDDLAAYLETILPRYARAGDGERVVRRFRMRHKSGEWRWLDGTEIVYRRDPSGAPREVLGVAYDVTERVLTEDSLKKSEARLRESQQVAKIGSWSLDIAQGTLEWSEEAFRRFDKDPADFTPTVEYFVARVHPDDREAVQTAMRESLALDAPYHIQSRIRNESGREWMLEGFGRVERGADGRPVRLAGTVQDVTMHTQAEAALRESEERFQLAMKGASDGLWDWDLTTDVVYYSPRWKSMLGYAPDELRHNLDTWKRLVHPDDRDRTLAVVRDLVEGRSDKFEVEFRMRHKDGSIRHILSRAFLRVGAEGGSKRLVGTHVDITDRVAGETALRLSEARMNEAQRISRLGSWELDLATGTLSWSDEIYRLFNLTPQAFKATYDAFLEAVHPDDREYVNRSFGASVRDRTPYDIVHRLLGKDGSVTFVRERGETFYGEDGAPRRSVGTVQDVTELVETEHRLREREEFIQNILDTVDEGFIVIDRDYRIVTANAAYCAQVGGGESVVGRHCYEVSHRALRPCFEDGEECTVRGVFESDGPRTVIHRHRDADGNVVYVETKAFPIRDAAGTIVSAIETVNNITERYLLEEERLKTQKLESIGTLAGGIAHDFNNLLQGVFGYISMAKLAHADPVRSLAMLDQAEKALHQSVNLTMQLLTFSKGGKPVKKPILLQPVIDIAVKFALSGSQVDYRLSLESGLHHVEADAGQIGQVIQNIVLNACQAMPLGGTVVVGARNVRSPDKGLPAGLAPGEFVALEIRDTGTGIPAAHLARIFDPYFTTKEKGSGLGLATSYSIVRNHGGVIDVHSESGKGSTFLVYLPAAETAPQQAPGAPAAPVRLAARVLVMDDEEIIRQVAAEMLAALGHSVVTAEKGESALQAYRMAQIDGRPFDLVILDLTIRGGMGGIETLEALRGFDPGVKAVVSSGYSDDATLAGYQAQGFAAVLKKPYHLKELQETMDRLLA